MSYEVRIYFSGTGNAWKGKPGNPDERERIGTLEARWLWLARFRAMAAYSIVNSGRCFMELYKDGEFVERWLEHAPAVAAA
jgi:hypothetical protein